MKKLFLFFIDGIGLGDDIPSNPVRSLFSSVTGNTSLVRTGTPLFFDGGVVVPADACLGIEGIPQSATGQATIFTGVNASKFLGYHLTAIPNQKLVELINERSLMKVLKNNGVKVTSANLYSKEFFEKRGDMRRNKFPVSTLTIKASGERFRYIDDYLEGKAVFADITNRMIRKRGYDIEIITPKRAADNLVRIIDDCQFIFFEYFMTDVYGHKGDSSFLKESIEILSEFMERVMEGIDTKKNSVLVISDHGNAEDPSTPEHTLNKVPAILFSGDRGLVNDFAESISSLEDIYPWVLKYFRR